MGVRRAVELALTALREAAGRQVYTLGPLIHNPRVLEDLRRQGLEILADGVVPPEPERAVVIIRAHGAPPQIEKKLKGSGALVVDATCPRVNASQLKAKALAEQGFCIFLAGEERHGELVGIKGYAEDGPPGAFLRLVGNPPEAEAAARELAGRDSQAKTVLIGQTTISPAEYEAIGEGIKKYFPSLKLIDTICGATRERQDSLRELCARAGGVVIAGGRQSANTRRLLDIALGLGRPALLVEGAGELSPGFRSDIRSWGTVGLCAGASTPDQAVDEIEAALESL
jgi:4-hydroxy-3-methylbut-2-enyl diphosphate reductase